MITRWPERPGLGKKGDQDQMGCSKARRERQRIFQKINQRKTAVDKIQYLTVDQIECQFEKILIKRRELAEAFLLGKNKYGKADKTPTQKMY